MSGWECIFFNVSASASSQLGLVRRYRSRWSPGARRLQIWTEPHSSQTTPHSIIDSLPLPQKSSRSRAYFLLNNPVKRTNQNCTTRKKASQRPSAVGCRGKLGELRPPSQGCPDTPPSINPVCFICHGVPLICNRVCVTYVPIQINFLSLCL